MKLKALVDRHAAAFGGNAQLAAAIKITNSGLLRGLKANRLSLETLIRLAHVTGENGEMVLRDGGQSEMAELIRSVFGSSRQSPMTPSVVGEGLGEIETVVLRVKRELLAAISARAGHNNTAPAPEAPLVAVPAKGRKTRPAVPVSGRRAPARVASR